MEWAEFKEIRAGAIRSLEMSLIHYERSHLPAWLVSLLMSIAFAVMAGFMGLRILWSMLKTYVTLPFVTLYVFIDVVGIIWWFRGRAITKMRGDR